ncbi:MAG: hypothetical protein ABWY45_09550 [Mycobacterium sp.]
MSSNADVFTALNTIDEAIRSLARQPFHQLRPADQRAVLVRLDAIGKQLDLVQRRELRSMVTGPPPVEFAGAPWAEVLARRLRISVGEAQRRIAESVSIDEPRSA